MKKSNKTTFLYITSSIFLFLTLLFGGCYGIYLSVGLSFVRQGVANMTNGGATNVSFGGSVNFQTSMIGVIILSIALIVIAIIDFISLVKQLVFFKQFSVISDSKIVKSIEKKNNDKGKIVFFAVMIDILSFVAGIIGIFINLRSFPGGNMMWLIYIVDGLISILSVASIVLLVAKLKKLKEREKEKSETKKTNKSSNKIETDEDDENLKDLNLNDIEYKLLKLKQLKATRVITKEEYEQLREKVIKKKNVVIDDIGANNLQQTK